MKPAANWPPRLRTVSWNHDWRRAVHGISPPHDALVANHVLLVEDNELARDALRLLLQVTGHQVSVAGSVAEALTLARGERPDLLLVDLTLPDGDGLEIVRELLVEDNPPTFVALTGHDTREIADRCIAAGCVSVIVKPVSYKELLATVDPLLARRT